VCVCVLLYHLELKTHARSEKNISYCFFMFHMKQREQKKTRIVCFSHPVNTHIHTHELIFICVQKKTIKIHRTKKKRQYRLETQTE